MFKFCVDFLIFLFNEVFGYVIYEWSFKINFLKVFELVYVELINIVLYNFKFFIYVFVELILMILFIL